MSSAAPAARDPAFQGFAAQVLHYFRRQHEAVPRHPVAGPAAWRGSELTGRAEAWTVRLEHSAVAEIDSALAEVRARGLALGRVGRSDFPLPGLGRSIGQWARELHGGRGFLLVRGLPVGRWSDDDAALAFWGIGQHLGRPGAQNPEGDLLGHVTDSGEEGANPHVRRYRTSGDIAFHCDLADAVGLLCLRAAPRGGASRIASSVSIYNEILARRPELVDRLFEPFHLDSRNEQREGSPPTIPVPPCRFAGGRLSTFWHSDYFRSAVRHASVPGFTPAERELLDLFDELAASEALRLDMHFEPGDIQLISNHTVVHARTAYEDDPARPRHLLRLWLSLEG